MLKIKEKIFNYFDSLTSKGRLLLMIGILIFLICFYMIFISNNYRSSDVNYNEFNSTTIIERASVIYNRDQIYSLDVVIDEILKINEGTWYVNNKKVTLNDLYSEIVTQNYKKKISKNNFKKTMNNIYLKLFGDNGDYNSNYNYIEKVYYSAEYDMYLIKLVTIKEEDNAYIGIRINNNNFLVTYVE